MTKVLSFIKENAAAIFSLIAAIIVASCANRLTKASLEIQIREMISTARTNYVTYLAKIRDSNPQKEIESDPIERALLQDYANAYDEACLKYLEKKVNRKSFETMYHTEIKNIVEGKSTAFLYENKDSFSSTLKAYERMKRKNLFS